ncbi:hypothetical protein [Dasania marina]|uniref:hypothetical protein n=1 Tax=Dasania marina TaxID=471499 RepID=UPI00035E68A7|nr:hypothetical protein [Dasania marina]
MNSKLPPLPAHFLFILLLGFSAYSPASQFFFPVAKTYNEQLYGEIQASGVKGAALLI